MQEYRLLKAITTELHRKHVKHNKVYLQMAYNYRVNSV